jgi:myo-inositol 2-dehydrogenase/D-chiro-inositol 1-dehydrogenase
MLHFAQFGAGRIGAIHAANLAATAGARLKYVVDVHAPAAGELAARHGARATDATTALADKEVGAVIIASSTDTHADLVIAAARAGKAIFCEKPIDLSLARVDACLAEVASAGVAMLVGFNRRFDPDFAELHRRIEAGAIGNVEQVVITSRDPGPPPVSYIKVSGGLFRDMTIHDFDMARFLLGEEVVEVFASAACLVDPAIGAAGDVDSALVTLRTASGKLCSISNSRRATYGYDQRIEAHGAAGMLRAGNVAESTLERAGAEGFTTAPALPFFLERYAAAYRAELDAFVAAVASGSAPAPGGRDGLAALLLADAAAESHRTGRAVRPASP